MLKNVQELDHKQAFRVSNRMLTGGLVVALIGLAIGALAPYSILKHLVFVPGFVVAFAGYILSLKKVRCPKCGNYPGEMPRMLSKLPKHCPNCGEQL